MHLHLPFKVDANACIDYMSVMIPSDLTVATWANLIRAHRVALLAVENRLKAADLPPLAWYDALLELERGEGGPLRPFELEQAMLLSQSNVSRLVDRLEEAGYLEKRQCPMDGRGTFLSITASGKAMRRRMWTVYAAAIEDAVGAKLSKGEARTAAALLRKLSV